MLAVAQGVGGRGGRGASSDTMQELSVIAVGAEEVTEQADVLLWGGLEQDGTSAVAEEYAGRPVRPVHDAGKFLGADDEGAAIGARTHHVLGDLEGIDEAGAGGGDVEAGDVTAEAELGLKEAGRGREGNVRRHGGDDEQVDVGGGEAGAFEGLGGGLGAHVRRVLAGSGDAAFGDAGAGLDPLVGSVHHLGQFGIGELAFWSVDPDGPNED